MAHDTLTAERIGQLTEAYLDSIRHAFPDGPPEEWAERLNESGDSAIAALRRFFWAKHYYIKIQERRTAQASADEREDTARALLRREPVQLTLSNGRPVEVTSRSYAAMQRIAGHWHRIEALDEELSRAGHAFARCKAAQRRHRTRARSRRLQRFEEAHRRIYREVLAPPDGDVRSCVHRRRGAGKGPQRRA